MKKLGSLATFASNRRYHRSNTFVGTVIHPRTCGLPFPPSNDCKKLYKSISMTGPVNPRIEFWRRGWKVGAGRWGVRFLVVTAGDRMVHLALLSNSIENSTCVRACARALRPAAAASPMAHPLRLPRHPLLCRSHPEAPFLLRPHQRPPSLPP